MIVDFPFELGKQVKNPFLCIQIPNQRLSRIATIQPGDDEHLSFVDEYNRIQQNYKYHAAFAFSKNLKLFYDM